MKTVKYFGGLVLALSASLAAAADPAAAPARTKLAGTELYSQEVLQADRSAYARMAAPYLKELGTKPGKVITVADGRIQFIVELIDDVDRGYAGGKVGTDIEKARAKALAAMTDITKQYGLDAPQLVADRVSKTFSVALTTEQAERLSTDPRVWWMRPNVQWVFSADTGAVWSDTMSGSETISWGRQAVAPATPGPYAVKGYVIDNGVALHEDLNIASRHNIYNLTSPTAGDLVGCYPHATHVAGIMGALQNNKGGRGIYPGLPIVSIAITGLGTNCSGGDISEAAIIAGLNLACSLMVSDRVQVGSVVNLSANDSSDAFQSSNGAGIAMGRLAASDGKCSPGAFIAHSAGNQLLNNSNRAYHPVSVSDGIMVVGAINNHGQPVVSLNGRPGFHSASDPDAEEGSNHGTQVEIWAAGKNTFGPKYPDVTGSSTAPATNQYGYWDGTSFAAPHIAGLAAVVRSTGIYTPSALEGAMRASTVRRSLGSLDPVGNTIYIGRQAAVPSPASTPYSEITFKPGIYGNSQPSVELWNDSTAFAYDDHPTLNIMFGQYGATSCQLDTQSFAGSSTIATVTGVNSLAVTTPVTASHIFPYVLISPDCPSGWMQIQARYLPTPVIAYDGSAVPVGSPPLGGTTTSPVVISSAAGHTLNFTGGTSAASCEYSRTRLGGPPDTIPFTPVGYSGSLQTYFDSMIFGMGYKYGHTVRCADVYGFSRSHQFFVLAL